MQDQNYGFCRYCNRQILWIKTKLGRRMPLDPEVIRYVPGGTERLVTPEGDVVSGRIDATGEGMGYISHFATCPLAHKARKSDRRKRA